MFVALQLDENEAKGILGRIRGILSGPNYSLEEASALGARYGVLHAPGEKTDWQRIESIAGHFASRMLLPESCAPPQGSGLRALACPRFERRVLLDTACEMIARTRMPMYRRVLGLVDPDGSSADMLSPLLHHYTSVKVVTSAQQLYTEAAEEMMEQLGAPVVVGESISMLGDCVLVLAPVGISGGLSAGALPCPVLTGAGCPDLAGCDQITGLQAAVEPGLAQACPPGIPPHRFAAALFETGNVTYQTYYADRMQLNCRSSTLGEVVRAVMQSAGTLSLI